MARHNHLLEQSERLIERTGDALADSMRDMRKSPMKTGGVIALILAAIGLAVFWPEIQRYLKIERM